MERIVNVGIIGCGGIANGKHMPSLKTVPNVRMVAFCDIVIEKAEKASHRFVKTDALLVGFSRLVRLPRRFVDLRNKDSPFL